VNATEENAIHAWVTQASGLAADHVLWEGRHPYPEGAWILMRVRASGTFGRLWLSREASGVDEIEYKAQGLDQATLQLQLIDGDEGGETACVALLKTVLRKRILPSFALALSAGGIGFLREGNVQWAAAGRANGEIFEPRAVVDIELTLASEVSEVGPAIKHVEVEAEVTDEAGVTVVDETTWVPDPPASET
jgi:hypothetical protein